MSLRGVDLGEIPEETARLARAVFPKGCLVMRVRDALGPVFSDADFEELFSVRGRPVVSPARLALVSVLQFAEGLTDRQAAHAVRSRLDWKYALSLELADTGFDFSVLSEFRARLVDGEAGQMVFDAVLRAAGEAGLVKAGGRQRTDATHVLAATRDLNRLEFVVETLRTALNRVAEEAGAWLVTVSPPEWFDRYSARPEDSRFASRWAARVEHADQCGTDGMTLLKAVWSAMSPPTLRKLPAVEFLRQTWVQQFQHVEGTVRWRGTKDLPPGLIRLRTPYEPEARTGSKRDLGWSGYKVHLSETCEPDAPHLITHVRTTPAPVNDVLVLEDIHTALAERGLLPDEHLVDAGYIDAEQIHHARRDHGIELVGPVKFTTVRGQATGDIFDNTRFTIDWDQRQAVCPGGQTSVQWRATAASPRPGCSITSPALPSTSPASMRGSPADHSPRPASRPSQRSAPLDEIQRGGINQQRPSGAGPASLEGERPGSRPDVTSGAVPRHVATRPAGACRMPRRGRGSHRDGCHDVVAGHTVTSRVHDRLPAGGRPRVTVWPRLSRTLTSSSGVCGSQSPSSRERAITPRVALAMWLTTLPSLSTRTATARPPGCQAVA